MERESDDGADSSNKNLDEATENQKEQQQQSNTGSTQQKACQTGLSSAQTSWRLIKPSVATATAATQVRIPLTTTAASKSISSQVMEYYQKYSQSSNLNQYFSLPTSTSNTADDAKYYYSIYDFTPKYVPGRQGCIGQDYGLKSYIPKERRRWVRPPLIGQSSSTEGSSVYIKPPMTEPPPPVLNSPQDQAESQQQSHQSSTISTEALIITEEKTSDNPETSSTYNERKASTSPTSSVASHKPLEWDSGADVGYLYTAATSSNGALSAQRLQQLSTLERMALARGCSAALRLDPEGTTGQQQSPGSSTSAVRTTVTATVLSLTTTQRTQSSNGRPGASSTPVFGNASGSENEIEITPIVKNHLPGVIAGDDVDSGQLSNKCRKELIKNTKDIDDTPKSSSAFKVPYPLKYPSDDTKPWLKAPPSIPESSSSEENRYSRSKALTSPSRNEKSVINEVSNEASSEYQQSLKKSSSMNLITSPTKFPLKRSHSELNLLGLNEKAVQRLIFNSSSSISTVVNNHKPTTCNKFIQTSMKVCDQESIDIQISNIKDEEKPSLPKRATSLASRTSNTSLKSLKNTYKIPLTKSPCCRNKSIEEERNEKDSESSYESSHNVSLTPQAEDTENITGRANSFEYFPGHIYENVPNGTSSHLSNDTSSHVSSVNTCNSNSTMPNTSSSIDGKLWGDSDSLVRDLERSVSILKSLVDANKLDKQVKRRLIHHVVKRLCSAKYRDEDKIEHNLEENVPWNPDDARNKIYRTEIIQALAKNTTDSSEDWKPAREQKKKIPKTSASANEVRNMKKIIDIAHTSSNSDKFDRNTDRTVLDGRKARMGVRADDCNGHSSSNTPTNKSESSECFLPQRGYKKNEKIKNRYITPTSNSSPQDQNRVLLEAVVHRSRKSRDRSNEADNNADWRLPATASERKYKNSHRNTSVSDTTIDSKVVTCAEMEKHNQLTWINGEITRLSNLKKLLETQEKLERSSKSSPSKRKLSNCQSTRVLPLSHNLQNSDDNQLTRNWSSHCNLANSSTTNTSHNIKRLKKRNSFTQTGTESCFAYSQSGSEVVSAKIQNPDTKLTSVYVQTPSPLPHDKTACSVCQLQPTFFCASNKQRVCWHCQLKNEQPQDRLHKDHEVKCMCNHSEDGKEGKNLINIKKLTSTYDVSYNKQGVKITKKTTAASQTCNQQNCEDPTCSCNRYRLTGSSETSQSQKDCECETIKMVQGFDQMQIKKPFDKAIGTSDHICQCKKSEEGQVLKRSNYREHPANIKPYFLAPSNNYKECYCRIKPKEEKKPSSSPKLSSSTNSSTLTDCKICRVCGTVYQNKRNCRCVAKTYPKAVAYELSFDNDCQDEIEINNIDQNFEARDGLKFECDCSNSQPRERFECECNTRKFSQKRRYTLQEYLLANNPTFTHNVEIRRQYVAEIQRMRELRKDRKVELLAMATTTNIFTPRLVKKKRCGQRHLTDEDLRARVRKRYYLLPEVQAKRLQQKTQNETRCNKLRAKIFCKKLQQKVLEGEVNLSQSISVISNL